MYLHAEKVPPQLRLTYFFIVQLIIDGGGKASQKDVELSDKYTQVKSLFEVKDDYWYWPNYVYDKKQKKTTPTLEECVVYFIDHGSNAIEAKTFFMYYDKFSWTVSGKKITKWKSAAAGWLNRNLQNQPKQTTPQNDKLTSRIKRTEAEQFATEFKVK